MYTAAKKQQNTPVTFKKFLNSVKDAAWRLKHPGKKTPLEANPQGVGRMKRSRVLLVFKELRAKQTTEQEKHQSAKEQHQHKPINWLSSYNSIHPSAFLGNIVTTDSISLFL